MIKNILYLMHVPWGWIKQRPHFIAEGLSESINVSIYYRHNYRKSILTQNNIVSSLAIFKLIVAPLNRYSTILRFNYRIMTYQLKHIAINYSHIWITHPDMYAAVKDLINDKHILIYDCMDDALEFPDVKNNPKRKVILYKLEDELVNRCNYIFASSDNLKTKLCTRYKLIKPINVVNNAISIPEHQSGINDDIVGLISQLDNIRSTKVIYIGTISEWLDFDLLIASANLYPDITYILIGPSEIQIPEHPQIIYLPPIQHKHIFSVMETADALVMPFKVNELVQSVNPVKIYEYIYAAKPIIVCKYSETNMFSEYVHLYDSFDEFIELIRNVSERKLSIKNDPLLYRQYASENTWTDRVAKIHEVLNHNCSL